jgi:hypothetical protein
MDSVSKAMSISAIEAMGRTPIKLPPSPTAAYDAAQASLGDSYDAASSAQLREAISFRLSAGAFNQPSATVSTSYAFPLGFSSYSGSVSVSGPNVDRNETLTFLRPETFTPSYSSDGRLSIASLIDIAA